MSDAQNAGTGTNDAGEPQKNADGQTPDAKGNAAPQGATGADDKQTADGGKPADQAGAAEVDYKFEAPEGVELDTKSVDEFKAIAKELKLPADQAQKIAGIAIKAEAARIEAFKKQVESWATEVGKDAELSKPETQAAARSVIDTFGTPELKALLNSTGMGNHPELVRFVAKVGKAMSEDKVLGKGNGDKPAPKSHAEILYGNPSK